MHGGTSAWVRRRGIIPIRTLATAFALGALSLNAVALPIGILARRSQRVTVEAPAPVAHVAGEVAPPDAGAAADAGAPLPHTWRIADLAGVGGIDIKDGTVGRRTVLAAIEQAGLTPKEALRWLHAFADVRKFDRAGTKDTFAFARSGKDIVAFEYATSPAEVWQARDTGGGAIVAKKLDLVASRVRIAKAFAVEGDLRLALAGAGLYPEMAFALDDALEARTNLHDLRPGTRLRVVATEEDVEGRFSRYSELLAVELLAPGRPALRVYAFGDKAVHFYDANGREPYRGAWRSPIPGARISSRFNPHRLHPVLHVVMPHNGADFAAASGTPVYAAASGTLRTVGDGGPCGNMVQIEHPGAIVSSYCHLSRFAPGLHAGAQVEARQLVGYVGRTGRTTGPHLHFAVKRGAIFIDPLSMKLDGVRVIGAKDRAAFDDSRAELDDELEAIALPDAPVIDADAGPAEAEDIENDEPL